MLRFMLAAVLALPLVAQTVRLANHGSEFTGWVRTTVDRRPPRPAGTIEGSTYVLGREIAPSLWAVDVRVSLGRGETKTLALPDAAPLDYAPPPLPANPLAYFGGPVAVNGVPMRAVSLRADGAAITAEFRARVGRMLCVSLWTRYYPGQPWAEGECLVVASNPAVPDMGEAVPEIRLKFGDAWVAQPGRGIGRPLLDPGTYLADGQGKALPVAFAWPRNFTRGEQWSSAGCVSDLGIGAVGIAKLWPAGNPYVSPTFNAHAWGAARFAESIRRLYTWEPAACGPNTNSTATGAQEDQFFQPGSEALQPNGLGCEWIRYLSASKLHAERPVNHLEADGSPLDLDRHPGLIMWDARPFEATTSTMLGKPRQLQISEAHNRWGPDTQHWLTRSLVASCRTKDSPLCQRLLRNLATAYLAMRTTQPGWGTTAVHSAREWCYEPLFALSCEMNLEDRALAARVVTRCKERIETVLIPHLETEVWFKRIRDDRVGPGIWVQSWQESIATYGVDLFAQRHRIPAARAHALRIAKDLIAKAWVKDGAWRFRPDLAIQGQPMQAPSGGWNGFGGPMCVAVVLRHEPENQAAGEIWDQLLAGRDYRWMPRVRGEAR